VSGPLSSGGRAAAAEAAEVPGVEGVGRAGAVALKPVLSVILAVIPSPLVFLRGSSVRGWPVSCASWRAGGVVWVHLGLQKSYYYYLKCLLSFYIIILWPNHSGRTTILYNKDSHLTSFIQISDLHTI
jgi:hypothetical protein